MRKQEPKNKRIPAQLLAVAWLNATNSSYHVTVTIQPPIFLYRLFVVQHTSEKATIQAE